MKNKAIIIGVFISLVISIGAVLGYHFLTLKKIAYVRTGYVFAEYKGMKDANALFENESKKVQANVDTLKKRVEYLAGLHSNVSGAKQKEIAYKLDVAQGDYERYAQKSMEQLEQRRQELTAKVIQEINTTIAAYGKKNHFRVILGSTDNGSILYAVPDDDITDDILEILNKNYKESEK